MKKYGIKYFYDITDRSDFRANPDYKGVCHVALAQEGHCKPGTSIPTSVLPLQDALRHSQRSRLCLGARMLRHENSVINQACPGARHVAVCPSGEVLFGTDSHTCNAGAFGQFATGIGNTDAGFILGTGKLLIKVTPYPYVITCLLLQAPSGLHVSACWPYGVWQPWR